MKIKLSPYWKCQLLGWGIYTLITYVFNNIIYKDFIGFLTKAVFVFSFGLFFSHLLKLTIQKLEIFRKKFVSQIIYLIIFAVIFSIIGSYLWLISLIKTGVWDVNELRKSKPDEFFYQFYLYNLFPILLTVFGWVLIYFLVHYVRGIRREEQLKIQYKFKMNELEAMALRAQINPHFIFNSLNSIKSLINKNENDKSAQYLTTFSKLIRTLFQNSDKREISLYEELETCRLYAQIERMRFGEKVNFRFDVDESIDLKNIKVPALILQPFIENAIWHGLVPKETGGNVSVSVKNMGDTIECSVDDDGIGRVLSKQYKAQYGAVHQSKGIELTRSRLEIDKLLNNREDTVTILDKTDLQGKPSGTTVTITFKENGQ